MLLLSLFCILICKYVESGHITSTLPLPTTYGFTETLFHPTSFQFFGPPLTDSFVSPPVIFQSDTLIHKIHPDFPKEEKKQPTENKEISKGVEKKSLSVDPMYKPIPEIKDLTPNDQSDKNDSFPPLFNKQYDVKLPSKNPKTTSYGVPLKKEVIDSSEQIEDVKHDKSFENQPGKNSEKMVDKKILLKIPKDFFFNPKIQPFPKFPTYPSSFFESSFIPTSLFEGFESSWSDYEKFANSKKTFPWSFDFKPIESVSKGSTQVPKVAAEFTTAPPLIKQKNKNERELPKQAEELLEDPKLEWPVSFDW